MLIYKKNHFIATSSRTRTNYFHVNIITILSHLQVFQLSVIFLLDLCVWEKAYIGYDCWPILVSFFMIHIYVQTTKKTQPIRTSKNQGFIAERFKQFLSAVKLYIELSLVQLYQYGVLDIC